MTELIVKKNRGIFVFQTDDIVYMEKNKRKICLRIRCKGCTCCKCCSRCDAACECCNTEFYGRFNDVKPYLDNRFMHCHRSYIINMDHIVWMSGCEIFVGDNISIHMGRDTYRRARKMFVDYLNEKYPEKTLKNAKFFL